MHGRTAALVHLLAFVALGGAVAGAYSVGPTTRDAQVILGVGLSAAGVFSLWSVLLSLRALWHGEGLRWPAWVTLAFMCEASAGALYFWPDLHPGHPTIVWLAIPLLVPFLLI